MKLARAYYSINDPVYRKRIWKVVQALARSDI